MVELGLLHFNFLPLWIHLLFSLLFCHSFVVELLLNYDYCPLKIAYINKYLNYIPLAFYYENMYLNYGPCYGKRWITIGSMGWVHTH